MPLAPSRCSSRRTSVSRATAVPVRDEKAEELLEPGQRLFGVLESAETQAKSVIVAMLAADGAQRSYTRIVGSWPMKSGARLRISTDCSGVSR